MPICAKLQSSHLAALLLCGLAGTSAAISGTGCSSDSAGGGASGGAGGASTQATSSGSGTSSTSGTATTTSSSTGGGTGGGAPECGPVPTDQAPPLKLTQVVRGLSRPLFVSGAPGDTSRLFVLEQQGRIRVVRDGTLVQTPFLNLTAKIDQNISEEVEHGLLGLAFHPNYADNGRFFVYYIHDDGNTTLEEYARSANPEEATPTPVKTLLSLPLYGGQHYGGMLAFGADGYLYVSVGDHSEESAAQNIEDKRGKLLRLDVDNHPAPPPGNLPNGDPHVWDYGLRNAWRFSFDRCSGDIYLGDVGGAFEEINLDPLGRGHQNFGWDTVDTGTACEGGTCPIAAYNHGAVSCSVTGGYVYRGSKIPQLNGRYLYGDWCSNEIWSLVWTGSAVTLKEDLSANLDTGNTLASVASFGEDSQQNLYVVDLLAGALYRIDPE